MLKQANNFLGYYKLSVDDKSRSQLLNICMYYNYVYKNIHITEDGRMHFTCSIFVAWRLCEICEHNDIEIIDEGHGGLAFFLSKYKKRYGIAMGLILLFGILFYSSSVVWDIRVEGNNRFTANDVMILLDNCGLYEGMKQQSFSTDEIENRAMIQCPDITWMAITVRGTVVNVQIREKEKLPERDTGSRPANLISSCDAQITLLEIYKGKPMVKIGQVVKKGDLLVSGVYDSATIGYRVTRSQGKVYAHTVRNFDIEIPFSYEEKQYTDEILVQKSLKIFKKEINIFKNSGNFGAFCDTIENARELAFSDGEELPISIKNTYVLKYKMLKLQRGEDEALELAKVQLSKYFADNFTDAELIEYSHETEATQTKLILHCTVHAIENIAVMQEFDIELK